MIKSVSLFKRMNVFLIFGMLATWILGLVTARQLGYSVPVSTQIAGFAFLTGMHLLFKFSQVSYLRGEARLSDRRRQNGLPDRILLVLFAILLTLLAVYFLIKAHTFEYLWLPTAIVLIISSALNLSIGIKTALLPYRWLLDSFTLSPIVYFFALMATGMKFQTIPFLFALPLFSLATASTLSLSFAAYQKSSALQSQESMSKFDWRRAFILFNMLIIVWFASSLAYFFKSGTLRISWPALLVLVPLLGISFLLRNAINGLRISWGLLTSLSWVSYLTYAYLIVLALLTH